MKRLIVTCLAVSFSALVFAQETGTDKKANVGIAYQFGMNFNKPGTNVIERDGVGAQNMIGLNVNFNFNENIGLSTGVEFDFESFKYSFVDSKSTYYNYSDKKISKKNELQGGEDLFELTGRKYKNIYATIPLMLMFRTNAIGDFRYYGKFGARTSFLVKSAMNDVGNVFSTNDVALIEAPGSTFTAAPKENEGMKVPYGNDAFIIRSALGIAGGAQWNFTGNTLLFAEIGFYYGLTPMHVSKDKKEDNMTMFNRVDSNTTNDYFRIKANQTQLCLKIGILF
ncbi:outer membrane beta-barrel protein [Fluviicola taffensis]|uniref:Outer membrane protein beta-barrel domain-containing protein n=1 Tax=Fluviicola taffensis (strain DSM 16823 / NCIMB 13979 / RW262) TaxID=755732 RepID=F2IBE8_FLUTR|nr:outer membrane beta-barrel protein [Fluviicola taffensis]AEA44256.1 hypothetical protein Fluta_2270 [Fluviicola taffensis DSM 16823]